MLRRKSLNPRGKSERSKRRQAWQQEMMETYAHITQCEYPGCYLTWTVAHAHSLKKTKIATREQYLDVVKLCSTHHAWIEYGGRDKKTGIYVHSSHLRMWNWVKAIQKHSRFRR